MYIYIYIYMYMPKHAAVTPYNILKVLAVSVGYFSYICVSSSQQDAPLKSAVDFLVR